MLRQPAPLCLVVARIAEVELGALLASPPVALEYLLAAVVAHVNERGHLGIPHVVQDHCSGVLCPPQLVELVVVALAQLEEILSSLPEFATHEWIHVMPKPVSEEIHQLRELLGRASTAGTAACQHLGRHEAALPQAASRCLRARVTAAAVVVHGHLCRAGTRAAAGGAAGR